VLRHFYGLISGGNVPLSTRWEELMTGTLLTRRFLSAVGAALLFSAGCVIPVQADPIKVTSGFFLLPDDDATYFEFFGTDGFVLGSLFINTRSSPHATCLRGGCTPGTPLSMSAVAEGDDPAVVDGQPLGLTTIAIVNGTEFPSHSLQLRGTLRFNAPVVVVPQGRPLELPPGTPPEFGVRITAPFDLAGHVTAFARDDLDLLVPLFAIDLVGRGTVSLRTLVVAGRSTEPEVTYTFSSSPPVPEPATVVLFGTGLAGIAARALRRKRTA
jgi:PEP-CTERM motif